MYASYTPLMAKFIENAYIISVTVKHAYFLVHVMKVLHDEEVRETKEKRWNVHETVCV